jgi:multidrug efflux pump subunit AcrB
VVDAVKRVLPEIAATASEGLKMELAFDQSRFVRAALWEVVQGALTAAVLLALMVLIFLGSPRMMLIVIISIPLSILTSIVGLKLSGQTINTMTLGGLALAVGMLVDDATVEVENIHRNHLMGKPLLVAILDGASQIVTPTLVGRLSICIVFFPVVLLQGVARYLFTPLALAVVYAMLTSYLLSRTLVTTMAAVLPENAQEDSEGSWGRAHGAFNRGFDRMRDRYRDALGSFIAVRRLALFGIMMVVLGSMLLLWVVGEDFFPKVDAGMMRLQIRAASGTRVEQTERIVDRIEREIAEIIPANEVRGISDNVGLPLSSMLASYQTDSIGPMDADILIQLAPLYHATALYEQKIRTLLHNRFPEVQSYFQAADIISQVLNFGLPAPINVQVSSMNLQSDYEIAMRLRRRLERIPGITDLRIAEPLDYPAFLVDVDRSRAVEMGISMQDVASSLLTTLSGNFLLQLSFWLDLKTGVGYTVISQAPQHLVNSLGALSDIPISGSTQIDGMTTQLLGNLATFIRKSDPAVINHYTIQRVIDLNAGVVDRDSVEPRRMYVARSLR